MCRKVVPREGSRQLVGPEALEEAGGSEMAGLSVAPCERVVGDLADERLDESVLAALGRAGVGLEREELAADEGAEARVELDPVDSRYRCEAGEGEGLAEDGGIAEEAPIGRLEAVETGCDEGGERLRDGERRQVTDGPVDVAIEGEPPAGQEHSDGFHRIERHAVGSFDDGPDSSR